MKKKMKKNIYLSIFGIFTIFILISEVIDFETGLNISYNFFDTSLTMLKVVPFAFILIGLFEVWVKRETIEKHLGDDSGPRGYFWAILLSTTTVGGLYVSLPVAYSIYRKGASLPVILIHHQQLLMEKST